MEEIVAEPWIPWVLGVGLPVLLIFGVAALKKLVRGPTGFVRADFYQGIELCWAVLGVALLHYYDVLRSYAAKEVTAPTMAIALISNTILLVITVCTTIGVATQHQELEGSENVRRQIVVLGVICNLIGVLLFAWFVIGIKGV